MNPIHKRGTAHEARYREWCSSTDRYVTPSLTRAEMADRLRNGARLRVETEIALRLLVADVRGTTRADERDHDVDGPWEDERCEDCGGFHHPFAPRGDGSCSDCGEGEHGEGCR